MYSVQLVILMDHTEYFLIYLRWRDRREFYRKGCLLHVKIQKNGSRFLCLYRERIVIGLVYQIAVSTVAVLSFRYAIHKNVKFSTVSLPHAV